MAAALERNIERYLEVRPLDVSDIPTAREQMQAILKIHGRIDALVNNAAIGYFGRSVPLVSILQFTRSA